MSGKRKIALVLAAAGVVLYLYDSYTSGSLLGVDGSLRGAADALPVHPSLALIGAGAAVYWLG